MSSYRKSFLIDYLRDNPAGIPTVRVSSAQARGNASHYSYWGAALYRVKLSRAGAPINVCTRRAHSDRRTWDGAYRDAIATGRLVLLDIGLLCPRSVDAVVSDLVRRDPRLTAH